MKLGLLAGVVVACTFWSVSAMAVDFSRVRCEDPRTIQHIASIFLSGVTSNGRRMSQFEDLNKIEQSTTVSADKDKLVCSLSVELSYSGSPRFVRGRFTLQKFGGSKVIGKWQPLY